MRKFLTVLLLLLIPIGWFLIDDKISFGFYAFVMVCFAASVAGAGEWEGSSVRRRAMDDDVENDISRTSIFFSHHPHNVYHRSNDD